MLKVMVFNEAVKPDEQPGEQWAFRSVICSAPDTLVAESAAGVVDHDVFVVGNGTLRPNPEAGFRQGPEVVSSRIAARVAAGGLLICFLDGDNTAWLPIYATHLVHPRRVSGRDVRAVTPIRWRALERIPWGDAGFTIQISLGATGRHSPFMNWTPLAQSKDGAAVAAAYRFEAGHVLLLPSFETRRDQIVRIILDDVLPEILPGLVPKRKDAEPAPPWVSEVDVPGVAELRSRVNAFDTEIRQLRERREQAEAESQALLWHRGLLWRTGFPLETHVMDALRLLGLEARSEPPVDIVCDLGEGRRLYIEIEGTEGPIALKKGQQLLSYIANADDPAAIHGAIVGNPHRKLPMAERPPKDQPFLFGRELVNLASKQGWALVQTSQIFELVCRRLSGDANERAKVLTSTRLLLGIT